MQDPRQMMDDLFAMKMISGDFDKKDGDDDSDKSGPSSNGHYPQQGGNSGQNQPSGGCFTALILMPVMPLISMFRNLFP